MLVSNLGVRPPWYFEIKIWEYNCDSIYLWLRLWYAILKYLICLLKLKTSLLKSHHDFVSLPSTILLGFHFRLGIAVDVWFWHVTNSRWWNNESRVVHSYLLCVRLTTQCQDLINPLRLTMYGRVSRWDSAMHSESHWLDQVATCNESRCAIWCEQVLQKLLSKSH